MAALTLRTLAIIAVDPVHTHGVVWTRVTFAVINVDLAVTTCEPNDAIARVVVRGRGSGQDT